jgi:hypothetical protein
VKSINHIIIVINRNVFSCGYLSSDGTRFITEFLKPKISSVQSFLSIRLSSTNLKVKIYRTIILPVVLYGCETWSLTLREGYSLRVFENSVLRRIFGPKWDEVRGEWRRLHSGELHILYPSPDIIRQMKSRRMRWVGRVTGMGEGRNMYRVLVGKPEGKRPFERQRHRWEDGIKRDLREIGWGGG